LTQATILCLPRSTARIVRVVAVMVQTALGRRCMRIVIRSVYPTPRLDWFFFGRRSEPCEHPVAQGR
jgi:hypothetical protein